MCEPLGKGEWLREWARPKELDDGWEEARIGGGPAPFPVDHVGCRGTDDRGHLTLHQPKLAPPLPDTAADKHSRWKVIATGYKSVLPVGPM